MLHEGLERAEKRNTDLRGVLHTCQILAQEYAQLFWDAEGKRKRAEQELHKLQQRCECGWRAALSSSGHPQ